jgi:hypothetical protein
VYRKFGEASEAAQLLETELSTLLLCERALEEHLLGGDGKRATEIMRSINRQTFGALIRNVEEKSQSVDDTQNLVGGQLFEY